MLEAAHSLTGAVIAYKIGNPVLALPLAFLSHYVADQLPHWNPDIGNEKKKFGFITKSTNIKIFFDVIIGLGFGSYVAFKVFPDTFRFYTVLAGSFFAVLPDLLEAPYYYLKAKHSSLFIEVAKFHNKHQWNVPLWLGMLFQIFYVIFLFWLIR